MLFKKRIRKTKPNIVSPAGPHPCGPNKGRTVPQRGPKSKNSELTPTSNTTKE